MISNWFFILHLQPFLNNSRRGGHCGRPKRYGRPEHMQKREKIIVIITIIAALYGVVDYWLSHHNKVVTPAANTAIAGKLTAKLAAISSPDNKRLQDLADRINKPWHNIFTSQSLDKMSSSPKDQQKTLYEKLSVQVNKFIYSGYLEMGNSKIAIINKHDYRIGDNISGFILQKISPVAIQLSQRGFNFTIMAQPLPTIGEHR